MHSFLLPPRTIVKQIRHLSPLGEVSLAVLAAILVGTLTACRSGPDSIEIAPPGNLGPIADFVEPGFPFITSTVDAREVDPTLPDDNVATRGLVLLLGDSTYVTFDPDLLRMAIGWRGEFISLTAMAQVSYQDSLNKNNQIPKVLGTAVFATGIYPGWSPGEPRFEDPRPAGPYPPDPGRGPLPADWARWEGVYVVGDRAVLAYTVAGTSIHEQPGIVEAGGEVGIARTFRVGGREQPLSLVAAEVRALERAQVEEGLAILHTKGTDSVTAVGITGAPADARWEVVEDRYAVVRLPAGSDEALFRVVLWRGPQGAVERFREMLAGPTEMVDFENGGPRHWNLAVATSGMLAPDSAAYVVDEIALPIDNPWRRNVRPADLAFFSDGRAAMTTFEGDLWLADGLEGELENIVWRRFASGLYEPMSVEIVDDEIYVYSRSGLIRLHDLNGDGEADFYENFSDLSIQTLESREFPLSMASKPGGGFYLSRGGALDNGPRTSPAIMPGFRAGSAHSGSVMELSADGRSIRAFATGLREPFIGVNPRTGMVTASDQQGNFVPTTPVYELEPGGYYGVPATAHREDLPEVPGPITWIPHEVDQSGAGQAWIPAGSMGFEEDALIHLSYGRPGAFRIYLDRNAGVTQGGAVELSSDFSGPLLKAEFNPHDGALYVAGFQIWGTRSRGIRVLARIRHTGEPSLIPEAVRVGEQGVMLRFEVPLDSQSVADLASYAVSRWNYQRTSQYGSGHFKLDGSAGEEKLPVAAAHLAPDGRTLLLVLPDMREVMQLQVAYRLRTSAGREMADTLYLTVNRVAPLDLVSMGLGGIDWQASLAAVGSTTVEEEGEASAARGEDIFQRVGCVACHSVDGSTAGKLGPTLLGVFGSTRPLEGGGSVRADEAYLRRSIEQPSAQIVAGYEAEMPAYLGVLSDAEVESLVAYLQTLAR